MNNFSKLLAAFLWGFLESTLFFLVPDILLSRFALDDWKFAFKASLFSVFGALLGGSLMYYLASLNHYDMRGLLLSIPAIHTSTLMHATSDLNDYGLYGLFAGAFSGRPYKIYSVLLGESEASMLDFLLITIPARLSRFIIVLSMAKIILGGIGNKRIQLKLFYLSWIAFYSMYFWQNA